MPSWSLVGVGDDGRPGPFWERLRLVRVLPDLPLMAKRDELMALQLEHAAFDAGDRTVAWVGAAHAYTDYAPAIWRDAPAIWRDGRLVTQWCRVGAILKHRKARRLPPAPTRRRLRGPGPDSSHREAASPAGRPAVRLGRARLALCRSARSGRRFVPPFVGLSLH